MEFTKDSFTTISGALKRVGMAKLLIEDGGRYSFHCPGCGHPHVYFTDKAHSKIVWKFNGNLDKPSFTPSLMNKWGKNADPKWIEPNEPSTTGWSGQCHLWITDGIINYAKDSTHHLAGEHIPMVDI